MDALATLRAERQRPAPNEGLYFKRDNVFYRVREGDLFGALKIFGHKGIL
jgi:hypothetical protein